MSDLDIDRNIMMLTTECIVFCPNCGKQIDVKEQFELREIWYEFMIKMHTSGGKPYEEIDCEHCNTEFTCSHLEPV